MKKLILIAVLVVCACLLISCGSEYDENYVYDGNSLVGKWQEEDFDKEHYKLYEFYADGTVTFSYYTYGISYGSGYGSRTHKYRVEGNNTLVLIEDFNGKEMESRFNFSINENNHLVLHADGEDVNVLEPYSLEYEDAKESPVIGKFIGDVSIESNGKVVTQKNLFWFLDSGECMIFINPQGEIPEDVDDIDDPNFEFDLIQTMLYVTYGEKMNILLSDTFVVAPENVGVITYKLEGDTLTMSGLNSQDIVLTRCK